MSNRQPKTKQQIKSYLKRHHKASKIDKLKWNDDDTGFEALAELHGIPVDELYQVASKEKPQRV